MRRLRQPSPQTLRVMAFICLLCAVAYAVTGLIFHYSQGLIMALPLAIVALSCFTISTTTGAAAARSNANDSPSIRLEGDQSIWLDRSALPSEPEDDRLAELDPATISTLADLIRWITETGYIPTHDESQPELRGNWLLRLGNAKAATIWPGGETNPILALSTSLQPGTRGTLQWRKAVRLPRH